MNLVKDWDNFYVIIGSSAAALTGLQFVVIALVSEARTSRTAEAVGAFGTPTIVHFCAVLLIAAILTTPRHTMLSLQTSLVAVGALGLIYGARVTIMALRQRGYKPVLEDWIFHSVLPMIAYAWLFTAGLLTQTSTEAALYCVAGAALMLLFIGIHNAWDTAVWMTTSKPRRKSRL